MRTKRFTIDEIRDYLNGCKFSGGASWNNAINNAITKLNSKEDGIEAVTERNKGYAKEVKRVGNS